MHDALKRHLTLGLVLATMASAVADENKNPVYDTPEKAAADPDFALQGEYAGEEIFVQAVARGEGEFLAVVYRGGLPGAGWNGQPPQRLEEDRQGIADLVEGLKKIERKSPTLGAKPPKGAVVLFDGTEESLKAHWKPGARMTEDGLLRQGATSTDTFRDFSIHLEFRLPYQPNARSQGRGNSGLYYQGRYETQMLDSFGLEGKDNECGGLYSIRDPDVNMCLPPLSWQTYDVDFRAARFDESGKKTANTRITVRLNGVIIHDDVELPKTTTAAPLNKEEDTPGPIYLQDHGSPVRYRNIWVVPRSRSVALQPVVPGFERFYTSPAADAAKGGRILLGELNCTSCHKGDGLASRSVRPKQAPILTDVGQRVHPEYMLRFIADPHAAKPGTTMPDLFAGMPEAERDAKVELLVQFLASTGKVKQQRSDRAAAARGERLFHTIGCVACHAPRKGDPVSRRTSVPLVTLDTKYSIPSLRAFLQDPHHVRPSGRMPSLALDKKQATDLACYFLQDVALTPKNPNLRYRAYHGSWSELPDFGKIEPVATGIAGGFDLGVAGRGSNFGIRFEGYLKIEKGGDYQFHLGSDDGSKLFIDGELVVDNDGVHAHTVKSGKATLKKGMHALRVDYAQVGGEVSLALEIDGPGLRRGDVNPLLFLDPDGKPYQPPEPKEPADAEPEFVFDPSKVEAGRRLFGSLGCAACHEMGSPESRRGAMGKAKPLAQVDPSFGCLAEEQRPGVPFFGLSGQQRDALAAALAHPPVETAEPEDAVAETMATFNCYACHERGKTGGPERPRNPLFATTIQEMGDEGRVPPPLDGVGDKLRESWLKHVMQNGANDRPYMLTRMPKFGIDNVGHLVPAFVELDLREEGGIPEPPEPPHRLLSTGRHLVGAKGLSCIKCHNFGNYKATGIQAIDLQTMATRIREDWFHRYMLDPVAYRPGTRMPSPVADGVSAVRDVYEGDPHRQLVAIWHFLKQGGKAPIPAGLIREPIELKPESEPIIYRNFLAGLSPRGIAVGYPEKAHLAFDAERLALTALWHGRFIDASKHWRGRGPGTQRPLGDNVVTFDKSLPVAILASGETPWPGGTARERGYRFRGYRLDEIRRPTFRYGNGDVDILDTPRPVAKNGEPFFERTLTFRADSSVENLYFRAATGDTIEKQDNGAFLINGAIRVKVRGTGSGEPLLRKSGGRDEVLVPVTFQNGKAEIVQEIIW